MRPKAATAPSMSASTALSSVTSQGSDRTRSRMRGRELVAGLAQPPCVLVADHHLGAFLEAAAGGGGADAGAGRGGDHDDLAVEQAVPGRRLHGVHPRAGRGRPSARAAMMFRWISSDPP